jgi:3-oxoadipate:acetyl-CoA acetyltransferase
VAERDGRFGGRRVPVIVNAALTGMVPTKERTPHVPTSVDEIVEDAASCAAAGASVLHVHARERDGRPTHSADAYAPIVEGIRQVDAEVVVCVSCSGRRVSDLARRAEVLDLTGAAKPDMASLTLGSNNFADQASANPPDVIRGLAERMRERGIVPELEAFEPGMVRFGRRLMEEGLIPVRSHLNILLGGPGTAPLSAASLAAFLAEVPAGWSWGLAGIGRHQLDATITAIGLGGHVRVGIEDNIWWDRRRTRLATNTELINRVGRLAQLADRPLASPREARAALGVGVPAPFAGASTRFSAPARPARERRRARRG